MKNSFSVKAILRKEQPRKDGTGRCPIYFQIIYRGGKTKTPSGKLIHPSLWDEKKKCPKDSLLKNVLMKEESRIYKILLEMENNDEVFTKETILKKIKGEDKETINPDFYFHLNEILKNKFAIEQLSKGTIDHYELMIRRLKSFKPKLTLNDINPRFIDDFVYYLKVELDSGNSGTNNVIKCLNTVLKKFVNEKLISENPCSDYKKFPEESSIIFLNPDELKRLINADLKLGNLTKGLEHTRNLFLFSCYTGLRDSDIKTLKKKDIIDKKLIEKRQVKTKKVVKIPYNKYWYEILKKNEFDKKKDNDLVLKYTCNAAINRHLKIIAKVSKIKKTLRFHAGRHTFGSLLALQGVPVHLIAEYMGHSDIKSTQIYMNTDKETSANVMKNVKF
jgi:integrase